MEALGSFKNMIRGIYAAKKQTSDHDSNKPNSTHPTEQYLSGPVFFFVLVIILSTGLGLTKVKVSWA
jgi:hypothetical protein